MSEPHRTRRPITARVEATGAEAKERGRSEAALREAFSRWATGVAVVAARDGTTTYAITATAFLPVSIDPPRVLVSINPNATVLPFLQEEGAEFGVSVLAEDQRRLASIFADTGPLAQMYFPRGGDPVLPDALAAFTCRVTRRDLVGDHTLVIGEVVRIAVGPDRRPLLYFRREYGTLG
ncbi:MAG TPA: flavin reductase family protein [Longimicrobiales bacterium]